MFSNVRLNCILSTERWCAVEFILGNTLTEWKQERSMEWLPYTSVPYWQCARDTIQAPPTARTGSPGTLCAHSKLRLARPGARAPRGCNGHTYACVRLIWYARSAETVFDTHGARAHVPLCQAPRTGSAHDGTLCRTGECEHAGVPFHASVWTCCATLA